MNSHIHKEEYVWQLPVRFYHWINALCVVILAITGYLIGRPIAISSGAEASFGYWFGTVRFVHFVTAFVFFFNFVFRIYWGFVGNKYAHWENFIPFKTLFLSKNHNGKRLVKCLKWTYCSSGANH